MSLKMLCGQREKSLRWIRCSTNHLHHLLNITNVGETLAQKLTTQEATYSQLVLGIIKDGLIYPLKASRCNVDHTCTYVIHTELGYL